MLDASRESRSTSIMTHEYTTITPASPERIEAELLRLAAENGPAATFCPSDAARNLGGRTPDEWGPLMQPLRRIAVRLAFEGRLVIYRKGKPVDPADFKGVYRLGLPRSE